MHKRSVSFHNKYFALINTGFRNQDRHTDIREFRRSVLCAIGFVGAVEAGNGLKYYDARSLSYKNCTQEELEKVFKKTVSYFIETLAINEQILAEVMSYEC